MLSGVDLDEAEGSMPVVEQLRAALTKNHARVLDLFREWDSSGDGRVLKREFAHAMPTLGFDAPRADVDTLFDSLDVDGNGYISFQELKSSLSPSRGKSSVRTKGGSNVPHKKGAATSLRDPRKAAQQAAPRAAVGARRDSGEWSPPSSQRGPPSSRGASGPFW